MTSVFFNLIVVSSWQLYSVVQLAKALHRNGPQVIAFLLENYDCIFVTTILPVFAEQCFHLQQTFKCHFTLLIIFAFSWTSSVLVPSSFCKFSFSSCSFADAELFSDFKDFSSSCTFVVSLWETPRIYIQFKSIFPGWVLSATFLHKRVARMIYMEDITRLREDMTLSLSGENKFLRTSAASE